MSQSICLTNRQQQFYNYFVEYQKTNGFFPNPSQASRDLRSRGVRCSPPSIYSMYGALFIKGAFNGGTPLTSGNRARHSAKPVKSVDISKMKIEAVAKPVAKGQDALAAALLELLKSSPQFSTIAAALAG
jgi:hypothetical protein